MFPSGINGQTMTEIPNMDDVCLIVQSMEMSYATLLPTNFFDNTWL